VKYRLTHFFQSLYDCFFNIKYNNLKGVPMGQTIRITDMLNLKPICGATKIVRIIDMPNLYPLKKCKEKTIMSQNLKKQ